MKKRNTVSEEKMGYTNEKVRRIFIFTVSGFAVLLSVPGFKKRVLFYVILFFSKKPACKFRLPEFKRKRIESFGDYTQKQGTFKNLNAGNLDFENPGANNLKSTSH